MNESENYAGREQTRVKHQILRDYLGRLAHIVGAFCQSITYVDCFSGPWNVRSQDLSDSSFSIALQELRKARETFARQGKPLLLRCFFLEKNRAAFEKLEQFALSATDTVIETRNSELENAVPDIVEFVRQGGNTFPFIFIDPTGWTGYAMDVIKPLLRFRPSEVLINFMTGHIQRFVESPDGETQESFVRLFGSADFKAELVGLAKQDREDAIVRKYMRELSRNGEFRYVMSAIVLHRRIDRTHFNLIYATRNIKGVEVFKATEKHAMEVMEKARAGAQQRERERKTQSKELFDSDVLFESTLYGELRNRYLNQSMTAVSQLLNDRGRVLYDDAWLVALCSPLVWESDLRTCLQINVSEPGGVTSG